MASMPTIQAEFDRIALLSGDGWDHSRHYHPFLLQNLPSPCLETLEIGCGTGSFSRLLAGRSQHVLALDLSPNMIRIAGERAASFPNIDFRTKDVLTWDFPVERFDCVASIATLHHLPMEAMLSRMKTALKTNGVLMVLDLFQRETLSDGLANALALPVSAALKLLKTGRLRAPREVREAWAEHERHDQFLTLSQIRRICAGILPGATVTQHLLWRYSIIWKKPAISQ